MKFGVYEEDRFVGVVVFGNTPSPHLYASHNLNQREMIELTRVALTDHTTPTSKIISVSLRLLKKRLPETRLVVSYADLRQGHVGTIYQASNWIFAGQTKRIRHVQLGDGTIVATRTIHAKYKTNNIAFVKEHLDPQAKLIYLPGKLKYLYPFDSSLKIEGKPYPKASVV